MKAVIGLLFMALIAVATGSVAAEWQGQILEKDGQRIIRNPEDVPETITVQLDELWRRGDEDDDIFFGMPTQILVDQDGNVYVLDAQVSEIIVFSPDGEYLRTIGREGEGPGEFRGANGMFMRPDGILGVVVVFPGKIVQLHRDGTPADMFPYPKDKDGGFQLLFRGQAVGDRVVVSGSKQSGMSGGVQMEQENYLKAVDYHGDEIVHYHSITEVTKFGGMEFDEKSFNNFAQYWTAASDGRVAAALTFDDYRVHVWKADGTLDYLIERPGYAALERTAQEKDRFQKLFEGVTRWNPNSTFEASATHRAIQRLEFQPDGSLWVLSGRGVWDRDEGVFAAFDVYDRDGRFVRRVVMAGPGDPMDDGMFFANGRFFRVTDLFGAFMANFASGGEAAGDQASEPLQIIAYDVELPVLGVVR